MELNRWYWVELVGPILVERTEEKYIVGYTMYGSHAVWDVVRDDRKRDIRLMLLEERLKYAEEVGTVADASHFCSRYFDEDPTE